MPADETTSTTYHHCDVQNREGYLHTTQPVPALSYDEGESWPVRKLLPPGSGTYNGGGWTSSFTAAPDLAEPKGYLAATQTPDSTIHLISSGLHYRFNLAFLDPQADPQIQDAL